MQKTMLQCHSALHVMSWYIIALFLCYSHLKPTKNIIPNEFLIILLILHFDLFISFFIITRVFIKE